MMLDSRDKCRLAATLARRDSPAWPPGLNAVGLLLLTAFFALARPLVADQPPPVNPFGPRPAVREDAIAGYVETSDGKICCGRIYLTRDKRLNVYDMKMQRQRAVPLRVVKQIDCQVKKEWMEKEWRFKELTINEKMYTGRTYPAREYVHTITLRDDRKISGPLSGIVYVKPGEYRPPKPGEYQPEVQTRRFILHKRDKGKVGTDLKSLHYVKRIKLGDEALEEGRRKAAEARSK